jgi:hypothetical protein
MVSRKVKLVESDRKHLTQMDWKLFFPLTKTIDV